MDNKKLKKCYKKYRNSSLLLLLLSLLFLFLNNNSIIDLGPLMKEILYINTLINLCVLPFLSNRRVLVYNRYLSFPERVKINRYTVDEMFEKIRANARKYGCNSEDSIAFKTGETFTVFFKGDFIGPEINEKFGVFRGKYFNASSVDELKTELFLPKSKNEFRSMFVGNMFLLGKQIGDVQSIVLFLVDQASVGLNLKLMGEHEPDVLIAMIALDDLDHLYISRDNREEHSQDYQQMRRRLLEMFDVEYFVQNDTVYYKEGLKNKYTIISKLNEMGGLSQLPEENN